MTDHQHQVFPHAAEKWRSKCVLTVLRIKFYRLQFVENMDRDPLLSSAQSCYQFIDVLDITQFDSVILCPLFPYPLSFSSI